MSENPDATPNVDEVESDEAAVAPPRRARYGDLWRWLAAIASVVLVVLLFLPSNNRGISREAAKRMTCGNNLKQIALALLLYDQEYGCLPPAYTVDANGQPLHSWRTLILPYLEREDLYRRIDLSKPWDHPDNRRAFEADVDVYHCPSVEDTPPGYTTYLAIVSDKSCLQPGKPRKLSEIDDGSHFTIVVVDVDAPNAVHWMSPRDASEALVLRMLKSRRRQHPRMFQVVFVDGSVRFIGQEFDPSALRAWMTATGHEDETIDPDSF